MKCLNCDKETDNPKFCSKSCSASFNNRKYPKREMEGTCFLCGEKIKLERKYCASCWSKLSSAEDLTLLQAKQRYSKHHRTSAFALVRSRARSSMKNKPQICANCGYDVHVEVCHIKAISEFPDDTMISEVNDESNLILLCPNCHWEFDHNILKLS